MMHSMRYVALLRGINVGGRSIKMNELRPVFEALGFDAVQTVAQSGIVVFDTEAERSTLKVTIEQALNARFHYPAKVQVYALADLQEIVNADPFTSDPKRHNYNVFFENGLEKQLLAAVDDLDPGSER